MMVKRRIVAGILSAAVSIMQLVPNFALISYAADAGPTISVEFNKEDGRYYPEDKDYMSVDLILSNNPGLNALNLQVNYDPDVLELDSDPKYDWIAISNRDIFESNTFDYSYTDGCITLNWESEEEASADGELVHFGFNVKENAKIGKHYITLTAGEKGNTVKFNESDMSFTDYDLNLINGAFSIVYDIESVVKKVDLGTDGTVGRVIKPEIICFDGFKLEELGEISYLWSSRSLRNRLDDYEYTDETYKIVLDDADGEIYVKISAEYCNGTVDSDDYGTLIGLKGSGAKKEDVETPEITILPYGFEIGEKEGYEYAFYEAETVPDPDNWLPDPDDWWSIGDGKRENDLKPDTVYYIYIRIKATYNTNASEAICIPIRVPNNDTSLASITVPEGVVITPEFDSKENYYDAVVPYGSDVPEISAEANDSRAAVTIKQAVSFEHEWDDNEEKNENVAIIIVTAENGTEYDTYRIDFTEQERSYPPYFITYNDESLSRTGVIQIEADGTIYYSIGDEMPSISSKRYDGGINIASLNIPLSQDTLTINAIAVEAGKAVSEVVSETYTLKNTDARLASLEVNGTEIEGFSPDITKYEYHISYSDWKKDQEKTYTVTASPLKDTSTVDGEPEDGIVLNGNPKEAVSASVTITVTSENGDKTNYTIVFVVDKCIHENDFEDPDGYVAPTCTAEGSQKYICEACGEASRTEKIPMIPHTPGEWKIETAATCTENGKEISYCEVCGGIAETKTIPATGHTPSDWKIETAATCTENGKEISYCEVCKVIFESKIIPATGHTPGEWTVETAATCTENGQKVIRCTVCNDIIETEIIPATGHSWSEWYQVGDTNEYRSTCKNNCGIEDRVKYVSDTSHTHFFNGRAVTVKEATCQNEGEMEIYCSVISDGAECQEFVTQSLAKTAHIAGEPIITKAPTCTESGISEVRCIYECGTVLSTSVIDAAGHAYGIEWKSDGTNHWHECTVCGNKTDASAHTSDNGVVTIPATETTAGEKTYSCTICRHIIRTEIIPATGIPSQGDTDNSDNPGSSGGSGNSGSSGSSGSTGSSGNYDNSVSSGNNGPYISGNTSMSGWDLIGSDINTANNGETVNVNMNGTVTLPQNIVSSLQGNDVDLVLNMPNGFSWRINGLDVTSAKDVNMGVSITRNRIPDNLKSSLGSEEDIIELKLDYKGNFGFIAELSFDVAKKYNNYYAYLYYYNTKTKELEYTGSSCLISNREATFTLSHASYYAIGFSENMLYDDVSSAAAATSSASPIDVDTAHANGTGIPDALPVGVLKLSNKKRRYRVVRKRRLDELVFVL